MSVDAELKDAYDRGRACMKDKLCKQYAPMSAVLRLDNMDCFQQASCKARLSSEEVAELPLLKTDFPKPDKKPASVYNEIEEDELPKKEPLARRQTHALPKH